MSWGPSQRLNSSGKFPVITLSTLEKGRTWPCLSLLLHLILYVTLFGSVLLWHISLLTLPCEYFSCCNRASGVRIFCLPPSLTTVGRVAKTKLSSGQCLLQNFYLGAVRKQKSTWRERKDEALCFIVSPVLFVLTMANSFGMALLERPWKIRKKQLKIPPSGLPLWHDCPLAH